MKTSGIRQIAERYVRALFEIAREPALRDQVEQDLDALQNAIEKSDDLQRVLHSPLLTRSQQAKAITAVLAAMNANAATQKFVALLAQQKRLDILPQVIALFSEWAAAARGEIKAEIISAAPLKKDDIAALSGSLGKAYGKKVIVDVKQDPQLLGGMIVKVGSQQLDGSLNGKLRRLKIALQAA